MMKHCSKLLLCLLTLTLLFSVSGAFAASNAANSIRAYVVADTMNVYQYPNLLSKTLGIMSYGEDVNVLARRGDWLRVQNHKGKIGYCKVGSLSSANPAIEVYGYVEEAGAYVYAKPMLDSKTIATVTFGDELNVVGMTKDKTWLRVKNGSKYGYILTDLVSRVPIWPDESSSLSAHV